MRVRLCQESEIAQYDARGFDPYGHGIDTCFVVCVGAEYFAYIDICPHYGCTRLPWKKNKYLDAGGKNIVCAAHGALFNVRSGLCTSGPCKGESLRSIPLTLEPDGYLWVTLQE